MRQSEIKSVSGALALLLLLNCGKSEERSASSGESPIAGAQKPSAELRQGAEVASIEKSAPERGFLSFQNEVDALSRAARCSRPRTTPSEAGLGALFGCVEGSAETAKLFINEEPGTGRVANVKVMWNDWFQDRGSGIHADYQEAKRLVSVVLERYAPGIAEDVTTAFFARQSVKKSAGQFRVTLTHSRGPAIDEHLLTIEDEPFLERRQLLARGSAGLFERCKEAISRDLSYSGTLSGDGEPIQEAGYKSFMLEGSGRDIFFCEVYPDGTYKVKAAMGGEFPFKYVSSGRL
jgi:hypothetical protein